MLSLTSVFRGVLRLSVKASFVSLILIVFRTLFHKYPKRYIYPLWLFLLARLIFPFSIPVSFSLMPLSQTDRIPGIDDRPYGCE